MTDQQVVFLSCGQLHKHELELGRQLCDVIVDCGYEPFYAQRRSDLRSLSEVIFDTLARSSAYIAVLHRRELLDGGSTHRTSLFIEQELAVAAYIRRSRELPILFYVQRGVERKGVRSTLLLNASFPDTEDFESDSEVLEHARQELPRLSMAAVGHRGKAMKVEIRASWATDGSANMMITCSARNEGTEIPSRVQLQVLVPREFGYALPVNQPGRRGVQIRRGTSF